MTLNELIALVGLAWSRLLLFPGGLAAFGVLWLLALFQSPEPRPQEQPDLFPTREGHHRPALAPPTARVDSWSSALGSLVPAWLALALLPLPPAPGLSRQTDVVVVLALLECPRVLAIAGALRDGGARQYGIRRLAAALNSYPPLILATLALAQAAGSFDIAALARVPGDTAPSFARPLHWVGTLAWALALPPLLGAGAFGSGPARPPTPASIANEAAARQARSSFFARLRERARAALVEVIDNPQRTGLALRALALIVLTALPWMAAFGALEEGGLRAIGGFAAWLLAPPLIALLAWGYDRLTRGQPPLRWARAYLALDGLLLLAHLWAGYQALQARLS